MYHSVRLQSLGHAQGGVSGERADFKDKLWFHHADQHLKQTSLDMTRCHAGVEQSQVGLAVDTPEQCALLVDVGRYILLNAVLTGISDSLSGCNHFLPIFDVQLTQLQS